MGNIKYYRTLHEILVEIIINNIFSTCFASFWHFPCATVLNSKNKTIPDKIRAIRKVEVMINLKNVLNTLRIYVEIV